MSCRRERTRTLAACDDRLISHGYLQNRTQTTREAVSNGQVRRFSGLSREERSILTSVLPISSRLMKMESL